MTQFLLTPIANHSEITNVLNAHSDSLEILMENVNKLILIVVSIIRSMVIAMVAMKDTS